MTFEKARAESLAHFLAEVEQHNMTFEKARAESLAHFLAEVEPLPAGKQVEASIKQVSSILASDAKQVEASIEASISKYKQVSPILAYDAKQVEASIKQVRARKGAAVRAASLSSERRSEIAKKAIAARWLKHRADLAKKHPIGFDFQHD